MVFKRSAFLLLAIAAAAVASTEASTSIDVQSSLKNPIVKNVKQEHGKLTLTLAEGAKQHPKLKDHKKKHKKHEVKKTEVKKAAVKKPVVHKKAGHKQVSESKKDGEVVKTYPHGQVHIATKADAKAAPKPAVKKHHKKVAKQEAVTEAPTEAPANVTTDVEDDVEEEDDSELASDDDSTPLLTAAGAAAENEEADETEDFGLAVGDSVDLTYADKTITLTHHENGSVVMQVDGNFTVLDGKNIYLDFFVEEDAAGSQNATHNESTTVGAEKSTIVGEIEKDVSSVTKKFSELATKLTGNGFKEATPIILIGGAIGALAAVVGIAAVAIGRARANSAAADPASVLADATEDVEADVEAAETEKTEEDAAADEAQALDSSDSESESEAEQEEGKFTNEVASV